jgi:hypothetical protein
MTIPLSWRIGLAVFLLSIVVAITWAGYRSIFNAGYRKAIAEVAVATAKKDAEYRAKERAWLKTKEEALHEAAKREQIARRDADAARSERDSLRNQLADAKRRMPEASREAIINYANALADVFENCAARYTAVAEQADGHANDARKVSDTCPQ